ncbi:hypothetical protein [Kordiimonas lacus]|uniref:Plastocyanin n=1 Tax=Kordiimonas lacus TaxID=637679 RepID=A0A1G6VNL4_9PROT|nr:hypothetical protein [Kordiimonas lacus]SDD54416.1 hypothetical protein SAMN04488071_0774 [Kordiimonas lacus]
MKFRMLALVFGLMGPQVAAADLAVEIRDSGGQPVPNAVVSFAPKFTLTQPVPASASAEMRQEGTMFSPFVLPVQVGTTVSFPNFDEFRHQVYSFSKPKRFELRLYGQDESKTIHFENSGVVALGCNIHDNMLAYIYVSEHPIVAKTGEDGKVLVQSLEPGEYDIHIWHPDLASGADPILKSVSVSADGRTVSGQINLRSIRSIQQPPAEDDYN